MLAAELAEENELAEGEGAAPPAEPPAEDAGGDEGESEQTTTDAEKSQQETEELDKENDLIDKFGFTFDDEGQIIIPEVCKII